MMNPGEWNRWLKQWFQTHPLKEPPAALQQRYRQEVMARIQEESVPSRFLAWIPRPRFTFAFGGALAAALAIVMLVSRSPVRQTGQIEQEAQILFETAGVSSLNDADLEEEVQTQDRIVLAEAVEDETARLWDELEEVGASPTEGESNSDEELLRDLQHLDDEEMALS